MATTGGPFAAVTIPSKFIHVFTVPEVIFKVPPHITPTWGRGFLDTKISAPLLNAHLMLVFTKLPIR